LLPPGRSKSNEIDDPDDGFDGGCLVVAHGRGGCRGLEGAPGFPDHPGGNRRISGTVHVSPTDCGGYSATGIVIYADFRWGRTGSTSISNNLITHNTVSLVSDTPLVVDVVAVELSEASDTDPETHVIVDNGVGFNDLRGTEVQIALTPEELADVNDISRNLGETRGRTGLHPSAFHED
jgi:hypothetical protein